MTEPKMSSTDSARIYKKLAHHFLTTTETVHYDGQWRSGPTGFVSYLDFVRHWSRIRFGSDAATELTPLSALEETLKALGSGSKAVFNKPTLSHPDSVVLEITDASGITRYRGKVFHDYEDAEWFRISVRLACESALSHLRKDAATP